MESKPTWHNMKPPVPAPRVFQPNKPEPTAYKTDEAANNATQAASRRHSCDCHKTPSMSRDSMTEVPMSSASSQPFDCLPMAERRPMTQLSPDYSQLDNRSSRHRPAIVEGLHATRSQGKRDNETGPVLQGKRPPPKADISDEPSFRRNLSEVLKPLKSLRGRIYGLRARVREKRTETWNRQQNKDAADNDYMKYIQHYHATMSEERTRGVEIDQARLSALYGSVQRTRDDHGLACVELNQLEMTLGTNELTLDALEKKLFSIITDEKNQDSDGDIEELWTRSDQEEDWTKSSVEDEILDDDIWDQFQSRLGDFDLARESYEELVQERENIRERQERRKQYKQAIEDEEDIEFLEHFAEDEQQAWGDLEEILEDVERLQDQCIRDGRLDNVEEGDIPEMPKRAPAIDGKVEDSSFEDADPLRDLGETDGQQEVQRHYALYSDTLNEPDLSTCLSREKSMDSLLSVFDEKDTGNRIESWMLHKLRSSSFEVVVFAGFFHGIRSLLGGELWDTKFEVFWFSDGAKPDPSRFRAYSILLSVFSDYQTDRTERPFRNTHQQGQDVEGRPPRTPSISPQLRRAQSVPGASKFLERQTEHGARSSLFMKSKPASEPCVQ